MRQLHRNQARCILGALMALVLWGLLAGSQVVPKASTTEPERYSTDFDLYSAIVERVAAGDDYYSAAVSEQVSAGFPVEPAATVRLPTLVYLNAALGENATYVVLLILVGLVSAMALIRFDKMAQSRAQWIGMIALLLFGLLQVAAPVSVLYAESWALLLTFAALLVGIDRRPRTALLLTAVALLLREHVLIFMGAMILLLWLRGHRQMALAWTSVAVVFVIGYVSIHVPHVASAVSALDPHVEMTRNTGWLKLGGWPRFVDYIHFSTPLAALPFGVSALVVPLALLGWTFRDDRTAEAIWLACVAYATVFSVVGRTNNLYWGLLCAPLLLPGLALSWRALRTCVTTARTG